MESYDLFMVLVLSALTLFGFWKGFAWQIAWITSIVVSYYVGLRFSPELAPKLGGSAPLAMLVIFIGCGAAIWIVFRFVSNFIDKLKLNAFDHQLGALLGFGRGVLWCILITFFAMWLPWLSHVQKENIIASHSGQYIVLLLDEADSILPAGVHSTIDPYIQRVRQELKPGQQPESTPQIQPSDLRRYFQGQGQGQAIQPPPQLTPQEAPFATQDDPPRAFPGLPHSVGQPVPRQAY